MAIEELRPSLSIGRRRGRRAGLALALMLPPAVAVTWLLRANECVPSAAPVEAAAERPGVVATCPPPHRAADVTTAAPLPERIDHVRPSVTDARWIAAWNDEHVYISVDGGASWQRRLDAASKVQDVAFDCFGRPIVLRENFVGIRDGLVEHWHPIAGLRLPDPDSGPEASAARLLGGGPDIVAITSGKLAVSHDRGATWRTTDLARPWEGREIRGRQLEDGTVLAMIPYWLDPGDGVAPGHHPYVVRWKAGVLEQLDTRLDAGLAFSGDRMVGSEGWQQIGSEVVHPHPALEAAHPDVIEGPYPLLVSYVDVYRIEGGQATRLAVELSGDELELAADPAGRLWSVTCGRPHLASAIAPERCTGTESGNE